MELNRSDLDVLIEAVEAWESSGALGELMGEMVAAIGGPKDGSEREEWLRKREVERITKQEAKAAEKRIRKERSILLRAKLIAIRDRSEVEDYARTVR